MKQTMRATKMIAMGLLTLSTLGLSNATFADAKTGNPSEIKFIGNVKDNPVFQLSLNNEEAGEYYIRIKDASNNVLYSEKLNAKDANYIRTYRLAVDEDEVSAPGFGVTFEVTSATTKKTQVYKISSQTSVKKNIVIAKL
jgi:flagellar hook assembly protein FlgD